MREFWTLPLKDLMPDEWEALCDGCAKCCCVFDVDAQERTTKPCRLLKDSRCSDYSNRFTALTEADGYRCVKVSMQYLEQGRMPATCAYSRRFRGEVLEKWQVDRAAANFQ